MKIPMGYLCVCVGGWFFHIHFHSSLPSFMPVEVDPLPIVLTGALAIGRPIR